MNGAARRDDVYDEREILPVESWQRAQWSSLRRALRYAYRSLPFYRRRFEAAGITPADLRSPQDLPRLPLLQKSDVLQAMRDEGNYAIGIEGNERRDQGALGMTSGTLGTAVLTFPPAWRRAYGDSLCRAYWWTGLRPGMRILHAAPGWHSMAVQESLVIERLGARSVVPWGTFLPRFAEGFLDAVIDARPDFISLFLPMLYSLIGECQRRGLAPSAAFGGVQAMLVVGAPLTPRARTALEAELGVGSLCDGAGNPEGLLAMECAEHAGHHYFVDICYVEIVDPESLQPLPPGQRGTIVISSLVPHGSVHLRFDTEDIGEILPGECACGRTWPRIKIYDRRANRCRAGGRVVLWYDVRQCLDELPALIGTPFAVIRGRSGDDPLRIAVQQPIESDAADLRQAIADVVESRLQVPVIVEWTTELPARWKGVTVIDQPEWEASGG